MRSTNDKALRCGPRVPRRGGPTRPRRARAVSLLMALWLAATTAAWAAQAPPPPAAPATPSPDHYQAARAALRAGNPEKAAQEVRLALRDNPLDAKAHFLFGCLLESKGVHDQAAVAFQRALMSDTTHPEALYNLGTLLLARGEWLVAARLLENAVSVRPGHAPSWNNLAKAYYQAGLPELTIATYEEASSLDPSNAVALENLRLLAEAAGLPDTAAAYRHRLEALRPGRAATAAPGAGGAPAPSPTWPTADAPAQALAPAPSPAAGTPAEGAGEDREAEDLRELIRDLPWVKVERRGGRLTLTGWTSNPRERLLLDRVLGKPAETPDKGKAGAAGGGTRFPEVLNLTTDDAGDPHRLIEIDAVIFTLKKLKNRSEGFNLLDAVNMNFNYFASDHLHPGTGYSAPPDVTGVVTGLSQQGWIFSASVDYVVNIANASEEKVAVLARPHLTTLSGTPARFLVGGELVYEVSGINSGDIKPYPFGTSLLVTPTLLRTPGPNGVPLVRVAIEANRTSALSAIAAKSDGPNSFDKISVTSEAVLPLGRTLILSGLNQRERDLERGGVPVLMDIPLLRYFFSKKTLLESESAVIILLTPRDPAFIGEKNARETAAFAEMRRAFLKAVKGSPEDLRRFRERYPDWRQPQPNRYATHFFLMDNNEFYRTVNSEDLASDDIDLEIMGPKSNKKNIVEE
ncbi:MAG: tetratricopeptide repeat protein [Acidobacteria bacterium]|nr:tetratricopeptide repeat protein [Acidobacteriota bacterium]